LQSPDHLATHALTTALFPKGDPATRETTPESVSALTIDDVQNYYRSAFRPDLTTIVVAGKVTVADAVSAVQKYFGGWQANGEKPDTLFPPAPTNGVTVTHVPDSSRVQDKATLGETLQVTRTNADYYALQLGNHVFGGSSFSARLYQDLREKNGLVYSVRSTFTIGLTRGVFQVTYACDPPNVGKARAMVLTDLRDMQTKPASAHEMHQAKLMMLRDIPLAESSVDQIADAWLSRSELGLPLDEPVQAGKIYAKLSADDVKRAFAKWLRADGLVQITQGPVPQ
jgi:zinc protease